MTRVGLTRPLPTLERRNWIACFTSPEGDFCHVVDDWHCTNCGHEEPVGHEEGADSSAPDASPRFCPSCQSDYASR